MRADPLDHSQPATRTTITVPDAVPEPAGDNAAAELTIHAAPPETPAEEPLRISWSEAFRRLHHAVEQRDSRD